MRACLLAAIGTRVVRVATYARTAVVAIDAHAAHVVLGHVL